MITVVVPTMWRYAPFLDFVSYLCKLPVVAEVIIINNCTECTPVHTVLADSKITMVDFGKNIFVNPAWNYGVTASKTEIVCILNDDLIFDIRLLYKVDEFYTPDMGVLGISNGVIEYGQTPVVAGEITFEPFRGQACYGFGNLMFVNKSAWCDIPEGLNIFFGDNFIFDYSYFSGRENYMIVDTFHHHAGSQTVNQMSTNYAEEKIIYDLIKTKLYDKSFYAEHK